MYIEQQPIFKELNPYSGEIDLENRWIKMARLVPWDEVEGIYRSAFDAQRQAVVKPCRLILGLWLGQMVTGLSDRAIVEYFHENPYFQYFCGQDSFVVRRNGKGVCHPSLLSKQRKRLGISFVQDFEQRVLEILKAKGLIKGDTLTLDATVFPANITYPSDIKLLNTTREWACEAILRVKNMINPNLRIRTYRRLAKSIYRNYCKVKRKQQTLIRKTAKQMIRFTKRNIEQLKGLIAQLESLRPDVHHIGQSSLLVIKARLEIAITIITQQTQRVTTRGRHIADRIVSLHQPQVRPVIRGKDGKPVEFGPKAHIALVNGFVFLDVCDYKPFHEGNRLPESLEKHQARFFRLPGELLADQIYATRANRALLADKQIGHSFPAIGRPPANPDATYKKSKADTRVRQRKRNHIEGAFGHLKNRFNLDKVRWTVPDGHLMQIQLGLSAFNLQAALRKL